MIPLKENELFKRFDWRSCITVIWEDDAFNHRIKLQAYSVRSTLLKKRYQLFFITLFAIIFSLLSFTENARAQLDVKHWIPPAFHPSTFDDVINEHFLVLSTPETSPVRVTVVDGAGNVIFNSTVSNSSPQILKLGENSGNGYVSITNGAGNIIDSTQTGSSQLNMPTNEGLFITADRPVYANIRHKTDLQGALVTSKGRLARGTRFRAGVMRDANSTRYFRGLFISVMATENNTTVNLDDFKPGVIFEGTSTIGSPPTTAPISVTLQANESYTIGIAASSYTGTAAFNDVNGTLITSNKSVVVSSGTWAGGPSSTNSSDIGYDQLLPEKEAGQEYILIKGGAPNNSPLETPIVIATVPNTDIFVNGSATPFNSTPLSSGDYIFIESQYSANDNMLIQASEPVLVLQTVGGSSNLGTPGLGFVPKLSKKVDIFVDNIPSIDQLGTAVLNVVAFSGATVSINGGLPLTNAQSVPGTSEWVTYREVGLTGNISVVSNNPILVSATNASGLLGALGFFSGFPSNPFIAVSPSGIDFGEVCLDSTGRVELTVRNLGARDLTIDSLLFTNPAFGSIMQNQVVLEPDDSIQINILFNPDAEDTFSGILTIVNNDSDNGRIDIALSGAGITPEINGATNVLFASTRVRDVDTLVYQLSNLGPCDLGLDSLVISGSDSLDFAVLTGSLNPPIPSDSLREFQLTFAPSDSGLRTTTLLIFSNDPDQGLFEVRLEGNGERVAEISVSPTNFDFDEVCLDSTRNALLTILNTGTADLVVDSLLFTDPVFSSPALSITLPPNNSQQIELIFAPDSERTFPGIATVITNAPDSARFEIPLSGVGIAAKISGDTVLVFDVTAVGESDTATYQLQNFSDCGLSLDSLRIIGVNSGDFFFVSGDTLTPLGPNSSRDFEFAFTPSDSGARTATLQFFNNDPVNNPFEVTLNGSSSRIPILTLSPANFNFNNVCLDSSTTTNVTAGNIGSADVLITSVVFDDPAFTSSFMNTITLEPDSTTLITVTFSPVAERSFNSTATIVSNNDADDSLQVFFNGVGIAPEIDGAPTLSFVLTQVGQQNALPYQLQNVSDCPLVLDSLKIVGLNNLDFSISTDFSGQIIPPQSSINLDMVFSPLVPGLRTATLQIFSNDRDASDNPFEVALSGTGEGVAVIEVTPAANLNFGAVCLDSTVTRFVTVRNIGSANLVIDSLAFSDGAYTSLVDDRLILPGNNASLAIVFAPNAEQDFPATATIVSNAADTNNYQITLNGNGIVPEISGNTLVTFDTTRVGEADTVLYVLSNASDCALRLDNFVIIGTNASNFEIISGNQNVPIAPNSFRTFGLEFMPSDSGFRTAVLEISSNDLNQTPFLVALEGNGARVATIAVSPNSLNFGEVCPDSTGSEILTISNTGTADLLIDSLRFSSPSFSSSARNIVVLPGNNTDITILFNLDIAGVLVGDATIVSNDPDSNNFVVSLSGTGITPIVSGNTEIVFQPIVVGESDTSTYQLQNFSDCGLTLDSLRIIGINSTDFFFVSGDTLTPLGPNSSRDFEFAFTPSDSGARTATLQFFNNDPVNNPFEVTLTGSSSRIPILTLSPANFNFNDVCLDSSVTTSVTASNIGSADVLITSVIFDDPAFTSSFLNTIALEPDSTTLITVTFSPGAERSFNSTATIVSNNDANDSLQVFFNGVGIAPEIDGAPTLGFPLTQVGQQNALPYQLQNVSDCPLVLDSLKIVGLNNPDFSISTDFSGQIIPPQFSINLDVVFSPLVPGLRTATLQIFSNDRDAGDNPFEVALSGTGEGVAVIEVTPAANLNFGAVCLDSTATRFVTVRNIGSANLVIDSLAFSDGAYTSLVDDRLILPGNNASLAIVFAPNAEQDFPATATIVSNAADTNNYQITLNGNGIVPEISGNTLVTFDTTRVGEADTVLYILSNASDCALRLDNFVIIGPNASNFEIISGNQNVPIAPNSSRTFGLEFMPSDSGFRTATLEISSNDLNNDPFVVTLEGNGARVATIAVSPNSLNFGEVCLDSTGSEILTISNIGTADLVIDSLRFSLPSFSSSARNIVVLPGNNADITILFNLDIAGVLAGDATIVSNDPDSNNFVVSLSGTGITPIVSGNTEIIFQPIVVGESDTATYQLQNFSDCGLALDSLRIIGTNSTDFFFVSGDTLTPLAPNSSRDFEFAFTPSDSGARTATLQFFNNDPVNNPFEVTLNGSSSRIPILTLSPANFNFNNVCLDSSATTNVTAGNIGSADVLITSVVFDDPAFTSSFMNTITLEPDSTTLITVTFLPVAERSFNSTATIVSNNDADDSLQVFFNGVGIAPEIDGAPTLSFVLTQVGQQNALPYQLQNVSDCPLVLDSLKIVGLNNLDFSISTDFSGQIIPPQSSINLDMVFSPSVPGLRTATLQIFSNDRDASDNPFEVALSGTGEGVAVIEVTPAANLNFGAVCLDSTVTRFVTVRNIGSANLVIDSLAFSDGAYTSLVDDRLILPGNNASLAIVFAPNAEQDFPATATIVSNAADTNNYQITLNGNGIVPEISGNTLVTFDTTRVGEADTVLYVLSNASDCALRLDNFVIIDPNASNFEIISGNQNVPIAPNSSRTFGLEFMPSDSGFRTATLEISSNDLNNDPFVVTLEGNGARVATIAVSPNSLNFGEVCLDSTGSEILTISNIGTADLVIDSLRFSLPSFSSSARNIVVLPGNNADITILFNLDIAGVLAGDATIVSNDPDSNNFVVSLSGTGITPIVSGNTEIIFQPIVVGESDTATYQLQNFSDCGLALDSLRIIGTNSTDFFFVSGDTLTPLAPNSSRDFEFAFTPSDSGARTATLQFFNNDPVNNPFEVTLNGSSSRIPILTLSPANFNFNNVCLDSSATTNVTAGNIGSADVLITSVVFDDPAFTSSFMNTITLEPDSTTLITVTFSPGTERSFNSTATIVSNNDADDSLQVFFNGVGIAPEIDGDPTLTFPLTQVGQQNALPYQLQNVSDCSLVLDSLKIVGLNNLDFSISTDFSGQIIPPQSSINLDMVFFSFGTRASYRDPANIQ